MERRVPDTGKLRALTGWQPRRTLADVLADAIADARADWRGGRPLRVPSTPEQRLPLTCGPVAETALAGR
ncbi:hypothetical protein [Streptomyces sp. CA-106131]